MAADTQGKQGQYVRARIRQERSFTPRAMGLLFGERVFRLAQHVNHHVFSWTPGLEGGYLELLVAMDEGVFEDDEGLRGLMRTIDRQPIEARILFCAGYHDEAVLEEVNLRLFYQEERDYLLAHGCRVYGLRGLKTWRHAVIVRAPGGDGWRYYRVDGNFNVSSRVRHVPHLRTAIKQALAGMDYEPLGVEETSALLGTNRRW